MTLIPAKLVADIPPGSVYELETPDHTFAVCNVAGQIHCVDGVCPHAGGPLAQGALHGSTLICPWHSWEFNVVTGVGDDCSLQTYPVVIQDGRVFIQFA